MIKSYDEILETMMKTFCEKSGENADRIGDVGIRLQAVAGELYSLSCYGDFIIRQAFPQTANSAYLDKHAKLRGTKRKEAENATVKLLFSAPEPVERDLVIPFTTVCAVKDKPYIQFRLENSYYIRAGQSSVVATATAISAGEEYNVEANTITVMVNPPAGVSSVTNTAPAIGGFSGENDEMLRKRLVNTFKAPPSGLTLISMASVVESLDEVIECRILKNEKALDVYVRTPNNALSNDLKAKIKSALAATELLGFSVNIICAKPVSVDITARASFNSIRSSSTYAKIREIVRQMVSANGIGRSLELDELAKKCMPLEEVIQISFTSAENENGIVSIDNDEYLYLKDFEVIEDA